MALNRPALTVALQRAVTRFAIANDWAPVSELPLPNGRRADLCALTPKGNFVIVEVKSCPEDFAADRKWPAYRDYCDQFFFAVTPDFPEPILPDDAGLLVCEREETARRREAPIHLLAPARRQAMLRRFARFAALRCLAIGDPAILASARGGSAPE
jgi:hypothetical protein